MIGERRIVVTEKRIKDNVLCMIGERSRSLSRRGNKRIKNGLREHRNIKMNKTVRQQPRRQKEPKRLKNPRKIRPKRRRISAAKSRETSPKTSLILTWDSPQMSLTSVSVIRSTQTSQKTTLTILITSLFHRDIHMVVVTIMDHPNTITTEAMTSCQTLSSPNYTFKMTNDNHLNIA